MKVWRIENEKYDILGNDFQKKLIFFTLKDERMAFLIYPCQWPCSKLQKFSFLSCGFHCNGQKIIYEILEMSKIFIITRQCHLLTQENRILVNTFLTLAQL